MEVLPATQRIMCLEVLLCAVEGPVQPGDSTVVTTPVLEGAGGLSGWVGAVQEDLDERGPAPARPHRTRRHSTCERPGMVGGRTVVAAALEGSVGVGAVPVTFDEELVHARGQRAQRIQQTRRPGPRTLPGSGARCRR